MEAVCVVCTCACVSQGGGPGRAETHPRTPFLFNGETAAFVVTAEAVPSALPFPLPVTFRAG